MIGVSEAWKDIQQRFLLPETFVEIDCTISEVGVEKGATATGTNETVFSNANGVLNDTLKSARHATNELNLWALDGSRSILPSIVPYGSSGYVSNTAATGSVTLSFPFVREAPTPGLTITWSNLYEEYPTVFSVTAKNGDTTVAETTVTNNKDRVSAVFLNTKDYDSIVVTVHEWCLPNRRARIERIVIGHVLTLTKNDIISFKHEMTGDLLSGELPKNTIEFTLDNTDGRWNPANPTGMEQYLSERQKLVVRYGMDVGGTVEWIKGGVFYLSEWDAPSNGLGARFVARDSLEFMLNREMREGKSGTLAELITYAVPSDVNVLVHEDLAQYSTQYNPTSSAAELVQMCANAGMCVMRYDRNGVLNIEPLNTTLSEYTITSALSYSHPEVRLSKPLGTISVNYGGDAPYELFVSETGEKQTVDNKLVVDESRASRLALWVKDFLQHRKTVSGEFRADPRLDVFDVVDVESKYGILTPVVITNITYTYNGSFRGSYTGRLLEG